jgi:hypothetical protein
MSLTETILLLTLLAAVFQIGYMVGKDKNNRH